MFRNMEYVYCVYKERSFSKAAEKAAHRPALAERDDPQGGGAGPVRPSLSGRPGPSP